MFEHPGRSLKMYGKVVFIIGVILSILGGIGMFIMAGNASQSYYGRGASGMFVVGGIVTIAVGIFVSYLLSIFVIAFGELVENSTIIRGYMENRQNGTPNSPTTSFYTFPKPSESFVPFTPQNNHAQTAESHVNLNKGTVVCPSCHVENTSQAAFCRNCGIKLK